MSDQVLPRQSATTVSARVRLHGLLWLPALTASPRWLAAADGAGRMAPALAPDIVVAAGETQTISSSTRVKSLTIAPGGKLVAPEGSEISVIVNGVETGSKLDAMTERGGLHSYIAAGRYQGDVVIAVTDQTTADFNNTTFYFRQALYIGSGGVVAARSAQAGAISGTVTATYATGINLVSNGENYNGLYLTDGGYRLSRSRFQFNGNARSDFIGNGATVLVAGERTRLVMDEVTIQNKGVVRAAVVADRSCNLIVKNSRIHCGDSVLPKDYVRTSDMSYMIVVPWMIGLSGNARTTNLLGTNTRATYINSRLSSENWGVLSVDAGTNCVLTTINSTVLNTGVDGYGSYAIGNVTEHLLGTRFDVASYVNINWGGTLHYGDSSREAVAALNQSLILGLSATELREIKPQGCVLNSKRFGWLWHGAGPVTIDGTTRIRTGETTFLSKAAPAVVTVDGSQGASIDSANGVIYQLMDNDNPGRRTVTGKPWSNETDSVYTVPVDDAAKIAGFDPATARKEDAVANFKAIDLRGSFYNSINGGSAAPKGLNLTLNFTDCRIEGVISASRARHRVAQITPADFRELGKVSNSVRPVINNGVIVTLAGSSTWTVAGTAHLSKLVLGTGSSVVAPRGKSLTMTVDGKSTEIKGGMTYSGAIALSVT